MSKFPHPYLLISGRICDVWSQINPHAIIGAMCYFASHGITVLQVDTDEELAYAIVKIMENHGKMILSPPTFKKKVHHRTRRWKRKYPKPKKRIRKRNPK